MRAHVREFRLVAMCRVLGVHRSGYYAWLRDGAGAREREDQRLLSLIKHYWLASGGVYGYRKITLEPRLCAWGTEQSLGDGYHLHSHLQGLVVSGGGDGPVLTTDRWRGQRTHDDP